MKLIYGPVASGRLGRSLGLDPICTSPKTCSFDCTYCQLGHAPAVTCARRVFVGAEQVGGELRAALATLDADEPEVATLSGTGEPTLAANLAEIVDSIRAETDLPLALLTNSTLLGHPEVGRVAAGLEIVVAKLDASNGETLARINRPAPGVTFEGLLEGLRALRADMDGKLALQMMFMAANLELAGELADLARELEADEVQLNTPLRRCAVEPISPVEMAEVARHFTGLKTVNVYETHPTPVKPIEPLETGELAARGKVLDQGEVERRRPGG